MPDSIAGLLEKADLAVGAASPLVEESITAPLAVAAVMLRRRLVYPHDVLLVGVAGGTGSGKSSLVNAIAGSEPAVVGGMRPTTDRPLAVANTRTSGTIEGYLTSIGIEDISIAEIPDWLCLLDLPDTDSVELGHRLQVEVLVPRLDVIVWVTDPEKYRDSSLHHGYLEPLSAHSHRFLFVLNQIDRLPAESGELVLADFDQALIEDGIESPEVIATAAAPSSGPPTGVDEVVEHLRGRVTSGVLVKAMDDLTAAAATLVTALGPPDLDFEAAAKAVAVRAASCIAEDRESEATDHLAGFLESLAQEVGAVTAERIRSAATGLPSQIRQIVEELLPGGDIDVRTADEDRVDAAVSAIFDVVIGPTRETLRERASALTLATDLSMSTAAARSRLGV